MVTQYIAESFLLGLTMGSYCAVSCAPFVLPYMLSDSKPSFLHKIYIFLQFLLGRLAAYILIAAIASLAAISSDRLFSPAVSNSLLIAASLLMVIFAISSANIKFCSVSRWGLVTKSFPIVTGFLLGLNLCPPFVVALVNTLNFKSVYVSCVYFFFLFLGTTIYIIPVVFVSAFLKNDFFRRLGTYLGILVGIWFFIKGISGLLSG